jgi:hypothetical protein
MTTLGVAALQSTMAPPPRGSGKWKRHRCAPVGFWFFLMAIGVSVLNFSIGVSKVEHPPIPGIKYPYQNHDHRPQSLSARNMNDNHLRPRPRPRPPNIIVLESVLNSTTGEIFGDPQPLLGFAIIGHGKCGTTSLQHWLSEHPEISCPKDEILELSLGTPKEFITRLVVEASSSNTNNRILGIKNPGEIRIPDSIRFLKTYFPKTRLIVGIRHPVLWFESLYNFKVQNLRQEFPADHWGNPNDLIGSCREPRVFNCVGTHKGIFHVHLAFLGKTNNVSRALQREYGILRGNIIPTPNPVFLFDVDQLNDDIDDIDDDSNNGTKRIALLRKDLKDFLGLRHELGPLPRILKRWNEKYLCYCSLLSASLYRVVIKRCR